MVATVKLEEANGSTATYTVKSSSTGSTGTIRFKLADNATVDAVNPITIPSTGQIYSYVKQIRADITAAPDNQISNMIYYSDGGNNMSTGAYIKLWYSTAATTDYVAPWLPTATNDPPETTGGTTFLDFFGLVSTAAWTASTGTFSSTFTGRAGIKFITICAEVESTAGPIQGTHPGTGTEKLTLSYDES